MNENVTSLISYMSGIGVMLMGLSVQEWFGVIGALTTILTFLVNSYYKNRADKRAERAEQRMLRELRMKEHERIDG